MAAPLASWLASFAFPLLAFQAAPVPLNEAAALGAARAAVDGGRWPEADVQLHGYLRAHPDSAEALYLLAVTLFREDKPRDSLNTFTQAAQHRRPTGADLRYVALDYVLLNDFTDAQRWIARSLQETPSDGESWYAQGRIQYTNQNFVAALASYQRALQLMPASVKVENNLGLTYEGLNQPERAVAAYREAITWIRSSAQGNEQPLINLGILLTDRGQLDEAAQLLLRAEQIAPGDDRVHGALGKLYARQDNLAAAEGELQKAIVLKPDDAALHFQLGQVYRREKKAEAAAAELARSAALEQQARR